MAKKLAMPMFGKFFIIFFRIRSFDDLETWHGASGAQGIQRVYVNDDPSFTLTYLTAMSTSVTICGCGHLGHLAWALYTSFRYLFPWRLQIKFGFDLTSGLGEDL